MLVATRVAERLRTLEKQEIPGKSQNLLELQTSAQSSFQHKIFFQY